MPPSSLRITQWCCWSERAANPGTRCVRRSAVCTGELRGLKPRTEPGAAADQAHLAADHQAHAIRYATEAAKQYVAAHRHG
jgi:hypothetical protein